MLVKYNSGRHEMALRYNIQEIAISISMVGRSSYTILYYLVTYQGDGISAVTISLGSVARARDHLTLHKQDQKVVQYSGVYHNVVAKEWHDPFGSRPNSREYDNYTNGKGQE